VKLGQVVLFQGPYRTSKVPQDFLVRSSLGAP
jgi:hypothetical protein